MTPLIFTDIHQILNMELSISLEPITQLFSDQLLVFQLLLKLSELICMKMPFALEYQEAVAEFLCTIPRITYQQFSRHLALIHLCLNQKEISVQDLFQQDNEHVRKREEQNVNEIANNIENNNLHDSYYFEQELYQAVKEGNPVKLDHFLNTNKFQSIEGKMANTPLRHAKNLFIATTTKVGMLGAIPGGLDIEKTYQLMDLYIQECERLQTISDVKSLQYSMIQDFCHHTANTHIPEGISSEIYNCMSYIRCHTNENLSIEDIAKTDSSQQFLHHEAF